MDENLNKNLSAAESEETTTPKAFEEVSEIAEETAICSNEEDLEFPENIEESDKPLADETGLYDGGDADNLASAPENKPANLLRSAITAVIVLAVFAAVYFIVTMIYNSQDATDKPQQQKPMTEMSISSESEGDETNQPKTDADVEEAPSDNNAGADQSSVGNIDSSNVQIITGEEELPDEYKSAKDKITEEAKKKYGDKAVTFAEYNNELKTVSVNGSEKKCYIVAVVNFASPETSSQVIHAAIDSKTNEIWFDDTVKFEVLD